MSFLGCIIFLALSIFWVTSVAFSPENTGLNIRNGPGMTNRDTLNVFGRALGMAKTRSNDVSYPMNKTSLDKSWTGATLFSYSDKSEPNTLLFMIDLWIENADMGSSCTSSIEIACSTCYVKGMARGALTITEGFNFTNTLDNFKDEVMNITKEAVDQLEDYAKNTSDQFSDGDFKIEAFPTLDLDFNLENLPKIPEAHVQIEFEDLELYLDLDITLTAGATYTLNLFTSQTPAGFAVPGLTAGAVFSVDIILIAAAEIEIGSGIHIQLDDILTFNLELFNSNFSSITMPSGHYEFLPVTIAGEGSIQAILSLKASVGFEFESNDLRLLPSYSAGISADMFAYVADFLMGVKGSSEANEGDCEMAAFAEYTLAVGAAAGATVAVDAYSWGPSPNTTVPIWYTTLASTCAEEKSTTSTPHTTAQAQLRNRDDLITTSVTSEESYTIVRCITSGLVNCPANLQETTSYESAVTTTVTIESGEDPTFPAKTSASVATPMPFGTNVKRFSSTAGTPTAYTPSSTSNVKSILEGTANGTNKKLIIGLCVGLGVPFVATLAFGLFLFIRKRNKRRNENFAEQNSHNSSSNSMKTPVRAHEIPRKPVSQS